VPLHVEWLHHTPLRGKWLRYVPLPGEWLHCVPLRGAWLHHVPLHGENFLKLDMCSNKLPPARSVMPPLLISPPTSTTEPDFESVLALIRSDDDLSSLATAITNAGLEDTLSDPKLQVGSHDALPG